MVTHHEGVPVRTWAQDCGQNYCDGPPGEPGPVVPSPSGLSLDFSNVVRRVERLDISLINMLLHCRDEGPAWSAETIQLVEQEFRRFLILSVSCPGITSVPSKKVDVYWHFHILDTKAYAEDCASIAGRFLHHWPYLGLGGNFPDESVLIYNYSQFLTCYRDHFGEPPADIWGPQ